MDQSCGGSDSASDHDGGWVVIREEFEFYTGMAVAVFLLMLLAVYFW
jgi:hypothetical protein